MNLDDALDGLRHATPQPPSELVARIVSSTDDHRRVDTRSGVSGAVVVLCVAAGVGGLVSVGLVMRGHERPVQPASPITTPTAGGVDRTPPTTPDATRTEPRNGFESLDLTDVAPLPLGAPGAGLDSTRIEAQAIVGRVRLTLAAASVDTAQAKRRAQLTGREEDVLCVEVGFAATGTSASCGRRVDVMRDGLGFTSRFGDSMVASGLAPEGATRVTVGNTSSDIRSDRFYAVDAPADSQVVFTDASGRRIERSS